MLLKYCRHILGLCSALGFWVTSVSTTIQPVKPAFTQSLEHRDDIVDIVAKLGEDAVLRE